jgi:hypothetical protein
VSFAVRSIARHLMTRRKRIKPLGKRGSKLLTKPSERERLIKRAVRTNRVYSVRRGKDGLETGWRRAGDETGDERGIERGIERKRRNRYGEERGIANSITTDGAYRLRESIPMLVRVIHQAQKEWLSDYRRALQRFIDL